ncbi:hypothetical protein [Neisseria elongata]|uniref:hypothetical protein n=1 Tax=Neisseria elongata TaxID=495 RepID=UPI00131DEF48|nr:hypothetical protein [Neisseria elongata]
MGSPGGLVVLLRWDYALQAACTDYTERAAQSNIRICRRLNVQAAFSDGLLYRTR